MGLDASVCNHAHKAHEYGDENGYYANQDLEVLAYLQTIGKVPDWDLNDLSCPHRGRIGSYGTLHILRRALKESSLAAIRAKSPEEVEIDTSDPQVRYDLQFSNLCEHSDCEGLYLPVDFQKPLDEMFWGSVPAFAREMELARRLLRIPEDAVKEDYDTAYFNPDGTEWHGFFSPPADVIRKPGRYMTGNDDVDGPRWVWCRLNVFVQAANTHRLPLHYH